MLLLIDNYDSFTYNLAQYFAILGEEVTVLRNDEVDTPGAERLSPDYLVVSPGPGEPLGAGASLDLISRFSGRVPILGVCLGMQAIAVALGGRVARAREIWHGRASQVTHHGSELFRGLPDPFPAGRYHSLAVDESRLPSELLVTARSLEDEEIMGMEAPRQRLYGVQFHPESIMTPHGLQILANFLTAGVR